MMEHDDIHTNSSLIDQYLLLIDRVGWFLSKNATTTMMMTRLVTETNTTVNDTTSSNSTNTENTYVQNDSMILRTSFTIYGTLFILFFAVFCLVRKRFPAVYNVRKTVERLNCPLCFESYGIINWVYKLHTAISEDDIFDSCGMDAICFLRALTVGFKVCCLGVVISFVLLPLYARAPSSSDTQVITDRVVQLTVANIPEGSNYLYVPAVAAYLFFGYTMYLLLQEFQWFTKTRSKYLSQNTIENYTVYVTGIPTQYRTNNKLQQFFEQIFSTDTVVNTNISLLVPKLQSTVSAYEYAYYKLQHNINKYHLWNTIPTHIVATTLESVPSIPYYQQQVQELYDQIQIDVQRIENKFRLEQQSNNNDIIDSVTTTADPALNRIDNIVKDINSNEKEKNITLDDLECPAPTSMKTSTLTTNGDESNIVEEGAINTSSTPLGQLAGPSASEEEQSLPQQQANSSEMGRIEETQEANSTDPLLHPSTENENDTTTTTAGFRRDLSRDILSNVANIIGISGYDNEGQYLDAGFVTFSKLSTTNAAQQMVHSIVPFELDVTEAPSPDAIVWDNVGKNNHAILIGKLLSFGATVTLCLFWTVPVTFLLTLTEIDTLKNEFEFLQVWLEEAPWLEPLLQQLSPLLLVTLNDVVLPMILRYASRLEGLIGIMHIEGSLFGKLVTFEIIQTFFVASIAGAGIVPAIKKWIEEPVDIAHFLATTLPPQSSFYIQIVLINTVFGVGLECLRTTALFQAFCRQYIGPRLSDEERTRVFYGLRPLSNPRMFLHAQVFAGCGLHFMVIFVYATIAPITCYVLAFCFLAMNTGYRYQLIYIYPPKPDSGGRLWMHFIHVIMWCMIIAQLTLGGYLVLKKSAAAYQLIIPLIAITILFYIYIHQRHFHVAVHLSSEVCNSVDHDRLKIVDPITNTTILNSNIDFYNLSKQYRQPALKVQPPDPTLLQFRCREEQRQQQQEIVSDETQQHINDSPLEKQDFPEQPDTERLDFLPLFHS